MKTLEQILGDEFDRRYSDHIHPTVMKAVKTYLYKEIKEMVEEIEKEKLETFELGVMRGLKESQKAIEREKEKLVKSWKEENRKEVRCIEY